MRQAWWRETLFEISADHLVWLITNPPKCFMKINCFMLMAIMLIVHSANAQEKNIALGPVFQQTIKLYLENGIGVDYCSPSVLNNRLHLKAAYVTSRLGSAIGSNAIKQGNFTVGADWRFRPERALQLFAGMNTGFFHAGYESDIFDDLPKTSFMLQGEAGLAYAFKKAPVNSSLSYGYNIITGNGIKGPGTLFPAFALLKVYYRLSEK